MTVYINGTTGYSGPVGTIGDLTTTGNTTLGDASGDTLTINGSTTTLTQGTANGVAYLNGSKVLTTGSALTFSGGALGVTSSTTTALNLTGATACQINLNDGTQNANWGLGVGGVGITGIASPSTYPLVFYTNATERMRLDSSGNLGLGVTPSAWATNFKAIDINGSSGGGAVFSASNVPYAGVITNAYFGSGGGVYKQNGFAGYYLQDMQTSTGGKHIWATAPSGTAGSSATLTQAMTLDSNGKLLVGLTSATGFVSNLIVNRQGVTNSPILSWTNATSNSGHCHVISGGGAGVTADGFLAFGSGEGGAGSFTERMRITSSGNIEMSGSVLLRNGLADTYSGALSGNYTSGTWYTLANSGNLGSGVFVLQLYVDTYLTGSVYYMIYASVPFFIYNVGSNSGGTFVLPTMYGTGHANNGIDAPPIRLRLTGAGAGIFVDIQPNQTWTGLDGTGGKNVNFAFKRIG